MSQYSLINGCRLPETLSLFTELMGYSGLILDMVVLPGSVPREVVLCVFDYSGLKTGLEIDSLTGTCDVSCFPIQRKANFYGRSTGGSNSIEVKCSLGTTTRDIIVDYFDSKRVRAADFANYYNPIISGLGGHINMTIRQQPGTFLQ